MIDANLYEISTKLVEIDGETYFEARVRELPDVREYADTRDAAIALAFDTIETTAEVFREQGEQMPSPLDWEEVEYSGRVTLRFAKYLHRSLAITADRENVSLNSYLNTLISYNHGLFQVSKTSLSSPRMTIAFEAVNSCYSVNTYQLQSSQWTTQFVSQQREALPDVPISALKEIKALST